MMARKVMAGASGVSILSPLFPQLTFHHTGDNVSGSTSTDESANSNDATLTGATTTPGVIGDAFLLDGTSDIISLPSITGGNKESLSCWVNTSASGEDIVYEVTTNSNLSVGGWIVTVNNTSNGTVSASIQKALPSGSGQQLSARTPNVSINNGADHHIAVVYDCGGATAADQLKIYIDKVLQTLTFTSSNTTDIAVATATSFIGARSGAIAVLNGYIDEIRRFTGYALTQADVDTLHGEAA
jgi:hypothetical protein